MICDLKVELDAFIKSLEEGKLDGSKLVCERPYQWFKLKNREKNLSVPSSFSY